MNPEDIKAIFGMQPEAAVAYLQQKGINVSWDWQDMLDDAHATAFTVAKTAGMDVVGDIYAAVVKAAESGQTLEQFSEQLTPVLQAKGWWGRQDMPHPDTGEIQTVRLGSPHRLKTIYLTNMQSAYMAGRYAEMMDAVDTHPYWEYVAVNDERTRETHRMLHGSVYAADDPVWDSPVPALGLPLPLPGSTLIAQPGRRPRAAQPAAGNPNRGHRCQPIYRRRTPYPAHRHPHQRQIRRPQCRFQCQPRQGHALAHGFGGGG